MNIINARRAIEIANQAQHRHDQTITEEKKHAKLSAAQLIHQFSAHVESPHILDIGGETWYHQYFKPPYYKIGGHITTINLPHDMHDLGPGGPQYDVVLAMHVVEHSPFPLLVLLNIHDILKPKGFLYLAVPRPVEPFNKLPSHFTVLHAQGWEKLLQHAGFHPLWSDEGRFGDYDPAIEDRYICIKQR